MDYSNITDRLFKDIDVHEVAEKAERFRTDTVYFRTKRVYAHCLSCLDLTSLGATDSRESVTAFARKAADFRKSFPHLPDVATVCVFPVFVDAVGLALEDSEIGITAVAGGFPSGQTFVEVKMLECAMAEENGADEIDIVLNPGLFRDGMYQVAAGEIEIIRQELDRDTVLKVIIESGLQPFLTDVRKAAVVAMAGGADMVKTSTGKNGAGAAPDAVVVMCEAIRDYFALTGEKVGIKVAGGVRTVEDAVLYYTIVKSVLGDEWLTPDLFRIGASSLANDLLSAIEDREVRYF